jgi:hypothetical protein
MSEGEGRAGRADRLPDAAVQHEEPAGLDEAAVERAIGLLGRARQLGKEYPSGAAADGRRPPVEAVLSEDGFEAFAELASAAGAIALP